MTTPQNVHDSHGHIENEGVAWNGDGDQVALFVPPHGSAFVVFANGRTKPRLCQLGAPQARELFDNVVDSWRDSGELDEFDA